MFSESLPRVFPRVPIIETSDTDHQTLRKAFLSLDPSSIDPLLKSLSTDEATHKFVVSEAIPSLLKSFSGGSAQTQRIAILFLKRILLSLGRDDVTIDLVVRNASSTDARYRTLATSLIPLVSAATKVKSAALALALDRVPSVKCAFLRCLKDAKFEADLIETFVRNAVKDRNDQVRSVLAEEIPRIAPRLVREFSSLLASASTVEKALQSLPLMVEANGFAPLIDAIERAAELKRDLTAAAVLKCLCYLRDEERDPVCSMLSGFVGSVTFLGSLANVAEHFEDKRKFLMFLEMKERTLEKWRDRMVALDQSLLMVDELRGDLLHVAVSFANDDVAVIRNKSVTLWVEMIKRNSNIVEYVELLLSSNWQARMVAAKVIGAVGFINDQAKELAQRLVRDEVPNVRYCLASHLDVEVARSLFADTDDEAIRELCKL